MAKLYVVSLSDAEGLLLQGTITKGSVTRARILLKADVRRGIGSAPAGARGGRGRITRGSGMG